MTIMPVVESIERTKKQAVDVAVMCADLQYNPGSTPSAFIATAALFGGISTEAFHLAKRFEGISPAQRLKKLSATAVGVGAAGFACIDVVTYAGHRLKGTAPDDSPTVIGRALDTDFFQQTVLDSRLAPVRLFGGGLVIAHAFAKGALEPNYGQASE